MNTLKKFLVLSSLLVLIVASANVAVAGPAGSNWWRFVSDPAGTMEISLKVTGVRNTGPFATTGGNGAIVASEAATALCNAAQPECGANCAAAFPVGGTGSRTCGNSPNQFTITANAAGFPQSLHVDPVPNGTLGVIKAANLAWNQRYASDLLDTFTVRLAPNGSDGIATFTVEPVTPSGLPANTGPAPLGSFTVDTTGKTDLQIHQAIAAGYSGLGLGLITQVCDQSTLATASIAPSTFPGFGVRVSYPGTVGGFEVDPLSGQKATQEMTFTGAGASVPTMSEWGMAILVALLMITGIWMMRRRQRLQSA